MSSKSVRALFSILLAAVLLLPPALAAYADTGESADLPGDLANEAGTAATSVAAAATSSDGLEGEPRNYSVENDLSTGFPADRSDNGTELLTAYAKVQLDRAAGSEVSAASTGYALEKLREEYPTMAKIYEAILPEIQEIAAGRRTSTEISGSYADLEGVRLTYTAAELGYSSITDANINAAQTKAMQMAGLLSAEGTALIGTVVDALLSDCAYELYWFDKTAGYSYGYGGYEYSSDSLTLTGGYHISFPVSSEFAAENSYTVSTAQADTIYQAIETAQGIVQEAAGRADWSKLNFYRQRICGLTDYNDAAAKDDNTPYGNPWQLIWAFDGDPDTTVVCEGYAKAFSYLCELTNAQDGFQDVACYLVSGTMNGGTGSGGHMWNVVRTGGRNYLVDVTNCDDGTIGAPAQLFMVGYDSADTAGGYQFTCEGGSIGYRYDNDSLNNYGTEKLSIVSKAEITAPTEGRTVTLTVNGNAETVSARANERVTLLIRAPGATGVRIWNPVEQEWEYYGSYAPLNYLESRNSFTPGEWPLYAQACYNEYSGWIAEPGEGQWATLSNEVTLTVATPTVSCPAPNVTLNGTTYNVSVKRGEWLHAAVSQSTAEGAWYEPEVWKKIDDNNQYQLMPDEHLSFNDANELYIPAEHFAPGDYLLRVRASAVGCNDSDYTNLPFTVTEETPNAGLKLSKNTSACMQEVMVCGYVPGAHHMKLNATRANDPYWSSSEQWGKELFWHLLSYNEPGEYTLTLTAWSENDELLNTYTATLTMTSAENTGLETPDLSSFPRVLRSGDGISCTIGADERTTNLFLGIAFYPDGGARQSIYESYREPLDGEDWTRVELPAELFTQAGRYELFVEEYAAGESVYASLSFFREDETSQIGDVVLTANGSTADIDNWNSGRSISVTISSQSATAVRILNGTTWEYVDLSGDSVTRSYVLEDGDYTLIAQMTTDDPIWRENAENWNPYNWTEVNWTSLSNVVSLHVSSPYGQLAEPQLTMTPADGEVSQGEQLTVAAAPQTGATDAWIQAELLWRDNSDPDHPYWLNTDFIEGDHSLQLVVPTRQLQPGVYKLNVKMKAEGCKASENDLYFTVFPRTAEMIADGTSFNFTTWDEGIFAGQYSGSKLITPAASGIYSFTISFEGDPEVQMNQAYLGIIGTDIQDRTFDTGAPASMTFSTTLTVGEEYELVLSNIEELGTLNVSVAVNYGIIPYDNCLVLPASTKEIGEEAFAGTAAQRIDLPEGIESIGSRAFADSDCLCFVVIPEAYVQISPDAFENSSYVRIAAPSNGTVAEYANSAGITFLPLS